MKAAIVRAAGQSPVYGDFAEPIAAPGENLITVTAAALSPLARGRAAGAHYSVSGAFPAVVGVDGVGRLDDGRRTTGLFPAAARALGRDGRARRRPGRPLRAGA